MIYEYEVLETIDGVCEKGEIIDVIQPMNDPPLVKYAIVHENGSDLFFVNVRRLVTGGSGFVLKGEKWEKKSGY